jgi:exodeoxyribonuclease VII small subunit
MADQQLSFEQAMAQLEQIISALENGDVPLEKAIALFQEGTELSKQCATKLAQIESKMEVLLEQGDGNFVKKEFQSLEGDN